jgi:hypothetical protein
MNLLERIKDNDFFIQIKSKYDELDSKQKFIVNLSILGSGALLILIFFITLVSKVSSLKTELHEREELISWLEQEAYQLKILKSQHNNSDDIDNLNTPLHTFIETIATQTGIPSDKITVAKEQEKEKLKNAVVITAPVTMNKTNLRILTRFLFNLTSKGQSRNLTITELTVDTKNDPDGYLDANFVVQTYKGLEK